VSAATVGTVLVILAKPWHTSPGVAIDSAAHFDAIQVPGKPITSPSATGSSSTSAPTFGDADNSLGAGPVPAAQSTPLSTSTSNLPAVRSGVVWSNLTGTVTGGGLIASYCCAGASAVVYADTPVSAGRHYWELTLSVAPGKDHPSTYTTAGVTPGQANADIRFDYVRSMIGAANATPGAPFVAIRWGESGRYRNGDVLMFALDASRSMLAYGVNGSWLNGQPEASSGAAIGAAGSTVVPFVGVSSSNGATEGDRWIANFGGSASSAPPRATNIAPAPQVASSGDPSSTINKTYQSDVTVGGQVVPLPDGVWVGLAFFRGSPGSGQGDTMVLGQIENKRLVQMVAINAYKHNDNIRAGFPRFPACERTDYLSVDQTSNEAFGNQRCWWINHAVNLWKEQPVFRAARSVIDGLGITASDVFINVAIRRADDTGFVTAFYYFDPSIKGVQSSASSWADSEWTKARITADPRRVAYIDELRSWGRGWAPTVYAYRSSKP
jgi:hypothetical protein